MSSLVACRWWHAGHVPRPGLHVVLFFRHVIISLRHHLAPHQISHKRVSLSSEITVLPRPRWLKICLTRLECNAHAPLKTQTAPPQPANKDKRKGGAGGAASPQRCAIREAALRGGATTTAARRGWRAGCRAARPRRRASAVPSPGRRCKARPRATRGGSRWRRSGRARTPCEPRRSGAASSRRRRPTRAAGTRRCCARRTPSRLPPRCRLRAAPRRWRRRRAWRCVRAHTG
mmetsp:Transcript_38982/g.129072  ORF Transcript_38982/g.129072 Transcript_38982/m.129072 type:complete len:232 (-) Transcript_38982:233-928(-)